MTKFVKTTFGALSLPGSERKERGTLIAFADSDLRLGVATTQLLGEAGAVIGRSAAASKFKGKRGTAMTILAPAGLDVDQLIIVGTGPAKDFANSDFLTLGGAVMGKLAQDATGTILFDFANAPDDPAAAAADFALGLYLRAYRFDQYKTVKKDDGEAKGAANIIIGVADPAAARRAYKSRQAVAEGVYIARDLVNEPANVLHPEEFARRAEKLQEVGVDVEILDEKAMRKLGMRALLGVGQGSQFESRVAIMRWNGGGAKDKPIAFIGKGVCFDTGGISIKPAASMEDMKGDMAGAACVTGLMHALASRKAKANVIGAIGLVENMPDGKAQRPGDIVTSMSGQTIEIINTDAEGRLVLADVLWYVQDKFKPEFMIDLATLTGAILIALGQDHAGLFSNNDTLAERLTAAGKATGEAVWRMPLGASYDKLIDSKFADMKNTGGRLGGSITAAQFLQRFVNSTPWAHLDIAGSGMNSPANDVNQSWASGWGVRLLNRLVADHYEK